MIDDLLSRLDKVKSNGRNQWTACCPAHDDRDPSLAVKVLSDGRILIKCFAGCGAADVVHSVGLTMSDLFPDGCLGELKGWQQLQDIRDKKKDAKLDKDRMILEMAKSDRASGKRLSPKDLEREKQAYLRVRNGTENHR